MNRTLLLIALAAACQRAPPMNSKPIKASESVTYPLPPIPLPAGAAAGRQVGGDRRQPGAARQPRLGESSARRGRGAQRSNAEALSGLEGTKSPRTERTAASPRRRMRSSLPRTRRTSTRRAPSMKACCATWIPWTRTIQRAGRKARGERRTRPRGGGADPLADRDEAPDQFRVLPLPGHLPARRPGRQGAAGRDLRAGQGNAGGGGSRRRLSVYSLRRKAGLLALRARVMAR